MLSLAKLNQVAQTTKESIGTEDVQRAIEGPSSWLHPFLIADPIPCSGRRRPRLGQRATRPRRDFSGHPLGQRPSPFSRSAGGDDRRPRRSLSSRSSRFLPGSFFASFCGMAGADLTLAAVREARQAASTRAVTLAGGPHRPPHSQGEHGSSVWGLCIGPRDPRSCQGASLASPALRSSC